MRKILVTGVFALLTASSLPALAQTAPQEGTVLSSQPGKVQQATIAKETVVITAINKASRKLTIKNAAGQVSDIVAGEAVRNFDQIKVGDSVLIEYLRALSLTLKKAGEPTTPISETVDSARAKVGDKPAGVVSHTITTVAEVIDVDPTAKTITLQGKGPEGRVVVLEVKNPDQFKVVKEGDLIDVVHSEAMALSVQPAAGKPAK